MPDKITSNADGTVAVTPIVIRELEDGGMVRVLDTNNSVVWTQAIVNRTRESLVDELKYWKSVVPRDEVARVTMELSNISDIEAAIT
jgi:hypothetical protein